MKHYILDYTSDNDTQEAVNNINDEGDVDNAHHDSDENNDPKKWWSQLKC